MRRQRCTVSEPQRLGTMLALVLVRVRVAAQSAHEAT